MKTYKEIDEVLSQTENNIFDEDEDGQKHVGNLRYTIDKENGTFSFDMRNLNVFEFATTIQSISSLTPQLYNIPTEAFLKIIVETIDDAEENLHDVKEKQGEFQA